MISTRKISLENLITIDNTGVNIASFIEIKAALIEKYKTIYGYDIDLSTGNADGEFVNELALLINNTIQSIKTLYENLDVNSAYGIYLDNLCALSNVYRKAATRSRATIKLENKTGSTVSISSDVSTFQDQGGLIWNYFGERFDLNDAEEKVITVEAEEYGPITAPAGWINMMIGQPSVYVTQSVDAEIGDNAESDTALRSRRNQYISPVGMTVLQSLASILLSIDSIKDVKIYNNQESTAQVQSTDSTATTAHGIYIIIRQSYNNIDAEAEIGNAIYNKLTPGIKTTETSDNTNGISKSYSYIPTILGQTIQGLSETVYWKLAKPIAPTLFIPYTEFPNSGYDPNTPQVLFETLKTYLNELTIGTTPDKNNLTMEILMADPRQKGLPTINVGEIDLTGITNNDTYYDYKDYVDYYYKNQGNISHKFYILNKTKMIIDNTLGNALFTITEVGEATPVVSCQTGEVAYFDYNPEQDYVITYGTRTNIDIRFFGKTLGHEYSNELINFREVESNELVNPYNHSTSWTLESSGSFVCIARSNN